MALIFKYSNLNQIIKIAPILFIMICHFNGKASAGFHGWLQVTAQNLQLPDKQSFSNQIKHFLNHLIKASEDDSTHIFGKYRTIIARELNLAKLYLVSYNEVEDLLDTAVTELIDSLTLFSLPLLQNPNGVAIVFKQDLLRRINKKFDFHGLFNISVPSAEDGLAVEMKFLVIGQGKFIVGYDRNAKIKHSDYGFATGKYDYRELFLMDAKTDSKGNPGLINIKALAKPDGKLQWMKGPLNVDIHSMTLTPTGSGKRQILIQYDFFGIKQKFIDPIPIEKRQLNEF